MTNYINNQWVVGEGQPFTSVDPAYNRFLWEGRSASATQVEQAVMAAHKALPQWCSLPIDERIAYLKKFRDIVANHQEALTQAISWEVGKPLWEAATEAASVVAKLDLSLTAYNDRTGIRKEAIAGTEVVTCHAPHGVLAILGPFNFPAHIPNGQIIPALLAGNTVVFKPSEYTPYVTQVFMHYWEAAGLPAGVLNMVQGAGDVGQYLIAQPIHGVFFTGSYATGKRIHEYFSGKPEVLVALEMGGNNPLVVWDVADPQAAAYAIVQSAFLTAGQRCTCARRLILPAGAEGERVMKALLELVQNITVGPYDTRPEPFMGPVIHPAAAQAVLEMQAMLIKAGAHALEPVRLVKEGTALLRPGIVDVTALSEREDKECFGPLLQVIRVKCFEDAITEANNTRYGLAAGLISDSSVLFNQYRSSVRAGVINWNQPTTGARGNVPFGGVGYSGNYRPGAYYAADYCAYPVVSVFSPALALPATLTPGIVL